MIKKKSIREERENPQEKIPVSPILFMWSRLKRNIITCR